MSLYLKKSFEQSCRLCTKVQDVSIMIFSQEARAMHLQNKLNKYLLIEVEEDDKLPKNICCKCCSTLQMVCDFIESAHKAQEVLQEQSCLFDQLETNPSTEVIAITSVKPEPLSEDDSKVTGMEISVDPMMVLQNSGETNMLEQNKSDTYEEDPDEEVTDVTHLHRVDSDNVSIKLIRKVGHENYVPDRLKDMSFKPFPCITCRRSFVTELALKNHSWIHVNEEKVVRQYRCSICKHDYDHKADLIDHLKKHRLAGMCKVCGRIFRTERNLETHMAVHQNSESSFTCKVCGRSYHTRSNLKTHSITHSTARPFGCHICSKSFKRNQDLKFHINQHTGAKPYKCPFCDKCFASSGNCYSHRSRMHPGRVVEENVKKRQEQSTDSRLALAAGPVCVKGVFRYQCNLCDHSFIRRDNYTYHMYQHTGQKPFRCKICTEQFVTRKGLLLHHDKKHPGKDRPLALVSRNMLLK